MLAGPETAVVCFASVAALLALDQGDLPPDSVLDDPLADGFLEKIHKAVGPEIEDPGMAYTWSKRGVHRLVRREAVRFGRVGAADLLGDAGHDRRADGTPGSGGP